VTPPFSDDPFPFLPVSSPYVQDGFLNGFQCRVNVDTAAPITLVSPAFCSLPLVSGPVRHLLGFAESVSPSQSSSLYTTASLALCGRELSASFLVCPIADDSDVMLGTDAFVSLGLPLPAEMCCSTPLPLHHDSWLLPSLAQTQIQGTIIAFTCCLTPVLSNSNNAVFIQGMQQNSEPFLTITSEEDSFYTPHPSFPPLLP